jgi:hypothetical protein
MVESHSLNSHFTARCCSFLTLSVFMRDGASMFCSEQYLSLSNWCKHVKGLRKCCKGAPTIFEALCLLVVAPGDNRVLEWALFRFMIFLFQCVEVCLHTHWKRTNCAAVWCSIHTVNIKGLFSRISPNIQRKIFFNLGVMQASDFGKNRG